MTASLWEHVDELVDRAPGLPELCLHRLELVAARRWRTLGREIPPELLRRERAAAANAVLAPAVLMRIRDAYDGRMLVIKGPEAAAGYPAPALRPFSDVDVIVDDPGRARDALLAAGFAEIGDPAIFEGIHHIRPLLHPTFPLAVELHSRPKWPETLAAPAAEELFEIALPSSVPGVLRLPPAHHALILAAHAWAHVPLWRLIDLVDVAATGVPFASRDVDRLARAWGIGRMWATTSAAGEWILLEGTRKPWTLRTWARHLEQCRDRTVLESHAEHWLSPFWIHPPHRAVRALCGVAAAELRPGVGETVVDKLRRASTACRHALQPRSIHDAVLGPAARVRNRS